MDAENNILNAFLKPSVILGIILPPTPKEPL
jgi:hypothetical protein